MFCSWWMKTRQVSFRKTENNLVELIILWFIWSYIIILHCLFVISVALHYGVFRRNSFNTTEKVTKNNCLPQSLLGVQPLFSGQLSEYSGTSMSIIRSSVQWTIIFTPVIVNYMGNPIQWNINVTNKLCQSLVPMLYQGFTVLQEKNHWPVLLINKETVQPNL